LAFAVVVAAQVAESAAVAVVVEVVGIVVDVEVTGGPADPESQARGRSGQHYPRQSRSHHPERKKKIFKVTLITNLA
jgi:phage head maturation protease